MPANQQVFEYRGIDNLFVAKVTKDDDTGYTCDTPVRLSYIAEAAKSTDSNSEAHYYDNKSMIVINSEGADTITITMAPPELAMLAKITGRPAPNLSTSYIFATGDKFFAYPNNYNYYVSYYKDTFQHGGISLEEMLVPLVKLRPKGK